MAERKLAELSEKMRDIDFCMFSTRTDGGAIATRPMNNNRDVEYEGDSFFFTYADRRTVADIRREPQVALSFTGAKGLLGSPAIFIAIEGAAVLIDDKAEFTQHWTKDLDRWFPQGIDTLGILLIKAHAERLHYWDGGDEGELRL